MLYISEAQLLLLVVVRATDIPVHFSDSKCHEEGEKKILILVFKTDNRQQER